MKMYFKANREDETKVKEALTAAGISFEEVPYLSDECIEREVNIYFEDYAEAIEKLRLKYADNVESELFKERLREELVEDIGNDGTFFGGSEHVESSIEHIFTQNDEASEYIRSGKYVTFK